MSQSPMYTPPTRKWWVPFLIILAAILVAMLIWIAIEVVDIVQGQVQSQEQGQELGNSLVCNGADCSWFPTSVVNDMGISDRCDWIYQTLTLPSHWDCGEYTR